MIFRFEQILLDENVKLLNDDFNVSGTGFFAHLSILVL